MIAWTEDELKKIAKEDELQIAGRREDDSLRKSVTIWVVRLGDELYVRSYKGRGSHWFTGILVRHQGHIESGGVEKDVELAEEADPELNNLIDNAYRAKYRGYSKDIVESVNTPQARAATLRLVPLE